MALSVSLIGQLISDCETADFSAGATQDVHVRAGTFALGLKVSQATSAVITKTITSYDATDQGVLFHVQVDGTVDTRANGGFRIFVQDGSGNNGYWWFGREDVIGDFTPILIDPSTTPDTGTGTIDITDIVQVGIQFKVLSKAVGNNPNAFWDQVYFVGGVQATSLVGDTVTLQDIYNVVNTNAWGAMVSIDGALFSQAPIILGHETSGSINFDSSGEVLNWLQRPVKANWYAIEGRGNGAGTTNITMDGAFVRAGTSKFDVVMDSAALDVMSLSGSTFQNADLSKFASGGVIAGCTFDGCGLITPTVAQFSDCTVKNSSNLHALELPATSHQVTNVTFANNDRDVLIATLGTYTASGWKHSGSNYHLDNASAGLVTMNIAGGGATATFINTGGGSVVIVNSKQLTIVNLPDGVEVRIRQGSYTLAHIQNATGGQYVYAYGYTGDQKVVITIGGAGWVRQDIAYTLSSEDKELLVTLESNPSYI